MASPSLFRKPRALRPDDRVAVVAPAGPFDRESFDAGVALLAARYRVQYSPQIVDRYRYLAGADARRLGELNDALADPEIRAIFCARGGYGTMRLLDKLAPGPVPAKPLVGFSDITALHQWCQVNGFISIHGPVLTQLGRLPAGTADRLFSLLESDAPAAPLHGEVTLVTGRAEGPLVGGNLSVFTSLLGTPFMPPLDGAIVLLEDLAERPYRLDRMWMHLELAGVFGRVGGLALGSFTGCEERDAAYSSQEVLRDLAAASGVPCAIGFPVGHGDVNEPVALGARVRLDADAKTLTFLEPAVETSVQPAI